MSCRVTSQGPVAGVMVFFAVGRSRADRPAAFAGDTTGRLAGDVLPTPRGQAPLARLVHPIQRAPVRVQAGLFVIVELLVPPPIG